MKYCISYSNKSHIIDKVDEIIIRYDKNKILNLFADFIPNHKEQRIIVDLCFLDYGEDLEALKKVSTIHKERPELKFDLRVNNFEEDFTKILKSTNIAYFYNTYANNWDTFIGLVNAGVSDIYIVENMGFELNKIAAIAHEHNIQIRVFPNVAQSSWKDTSGIYKFFIRPEDTEVYEEFVDVYEFYGDSKHIDTYYKVYHDDQKWFGNLKEIIIDFDYDLDSKYVIPRFAEKRTRCGKECLKGGKCEICNRIVDLSKNLEKANLIVKIDKDKNEEVNNGEGTK